jgi:hypothetical protein
LRRRINKGGELLKNSSEVCKTICIRKFQEICNNIHIQKSSTHHRRLQRCHIQIKEVGSNYSLLSVKTVEEKENIVPAIKIRETLLGSKE